MEKQEAPTLDYAARQPPSARWRLAAIVVEWFIIAAAAGCAGFTLWAERLPAAGQPILMFGILLGSLAVLLWGPCAIGEIAYRMHGGKSSRLRVILITLTALLLIGTWALSAAGVPRKLMFLANKPAMDVWAKKFLASRAPPPDWARIGDFNTEQIEAIPGGVKFLVEVAGFFRSGGGYAYSPSAPPPHSAGPAWETFTPIGGGWYVYTGREE